MEAAWVLPVTIVIVLLVGGLLIARRKLGGRPLPEILRPGNMLPDFTAVDENGDPVSSTDLHGASAVMLFVRGNWCPFCSRQVANLTQHYQALNKRGARLILITPKPLETTRRVAEFFEFDFDFWLDKDLAVARKLGLLHNDAVPKEHRDEYGSDSLWPAAIVTDDQGKICYASISRFIADRPDPRKFLQALDAI